MVFVKGFLCDVCDVFMDINYGKFILEYVGGCFF